ncbi:MAG: hypothetical protein H5U40_11120 [Polyangiaceae bacterium]|nr:hypothetical protein [Polyangiaceae bacterium]
MSGLPEGTPIVCRTCGGVMDLHADASLTCGFCGARDQLPADQLSRVIEIKNRLALAEQRAGQVRGFDTIVTTIFENPDSLLRVTGVYLATAIAVAVLSAVNLVQILSSIPEGVSSGVIAQIVVSSALAPSMLGGMVLSLGVAFFVGRDRFRRHLRPILLARPPERPGAPFRCRACGGDLPEARTADVACTYCRTLNLVPKALHGAQAAAQYQDAEAARGRLHQANGELMSISKTMSTTLVVCFGATIVAIYGLQLLTSALGS